MKDETCETPPTPVKEKFYFHSPDKNITNDMINHQFSSPPFNDKLSINNDIAQSQRRQSLSTRYLMRNQQSTLDKSPLFKDSDKAKESIENKDFNKEKSFIPKELKPLNETHSNTIIATDTVSMFNTQLSKVIETNNSGCTSLVNSFPYIAATSNISTAQMTADLLKLKKNKAVNYLQTSLHFQHTESSLNKVKSRQAQQQSTDSVQVKLNKSSSMNSVVSTVESVSHDESDDRSIAMTLNLNELEHEKNLRLKLVKTFSPKKECDYDSNTVYRTDNIYEANRSNNDHNDNNLKKASSLISLESTAVPTILPSSASFSSKPILQSIANSNSKYSSNIICNTIHRTANPNSLMSNQGVNAANNTLPPKTVRFVHSTYNTVRQSLILSNSKRFS